MTEDEEFGVFWKHYPKRQKKLDAFKAWTQVRKLRPPIEDIVDAIERAKQCQQWKKDNGQFVPLPASWLRAGCWDDEYEVEVGPVGNWFDTASGIYSKADELGVGYSREEPVPFVRQRVQAAIEKCAGSRGQLSLVAA